MVPITEKRTTPQQPMPQPEVVIQAPGTAVLLQEGSLGLGPHIFVQNALGNHQGHGNGHYHQQHHHPHHHHSQGHPHHHHSSHHRAKENASGGRSISKGLEILDFHESWLEEMEAYKDLMHVKKLGSHNHAHTPQGCQLDVLNSHYFTAKAPHAATANTFSDTPVITGAGRSSGGANALSNATPWSNARRRAINENKARARVAATLAESAAKEVNTKQRTYEEISARQAGGGKSGPAPSFSSSNSNAKRAAHNSSHAAASSQNPLPARHARTGSPGKASGNPGDLSNAAHASASPPHASSKSNAKVIVNHFHASSLLNGHPLEEKQKILTQNGLVANTPAAAYYEASYYAANYLNGEARKGEAANANANKGYSGESVDDDPGAAIDDVNTYSDSDTDEEYTGEPFYIPDDSEERLQSKHVHRTVSKEKSADGESTPGDDYHTPATILSPSLFPNVPPFLNFSSHARTGPAMPQQLHRVLKWKLSPVMPKIVKRVVLNSGFRIIKNTMDWMAVWEKHMKSPGFRTIRSHQKYNHMPGSFRIGRKDTMWRSIHHNMKKFGSKEFGFMQRSYIMPDDLEELRLSWPKNASRLTKWIVKPPASARGTGISIVNKWSQFPKDRPLVVQKYIERPLLINDNKFDMRLYVMLTSVNPIRLYMYKDGLARFASVKYSSELNSLDQRCMHLTNYSINKLSQNYSKNEDYNACQGHKWTLQSLWSCLEERGVNTKRLWATLRSLVIKAVISGESGLNRMYRQNVNFRYNCFELFGFDVLLDENLVPWLLEINISPSLHSELPLDLHVKGPLIQSILNTALYQVPPKLSEKQQKEILEEMNMSGPLCHDRRMFTTCLRADEIRKHNEYTNRSIEIREEYLDAILDHLNPDDVRCLIISEDELNRCSPLERIFPTPDTHKYLKFIEHPRYYNRLLDAWEHRYGHCRESGRDLLRNYCKDNYHLQVAEMAMEKEPTVALTEIDLLHVKKDEAALAAMDTPDAGQFLSRGKASTDMDTTDDPKTSSQASCTPDNHLNAGTSNASITSADVKSLDSSSGNLTKSEHSHHAHSQSHRQGHHHTHAKDADVHPAKHAKAKHDVNESAQRATKGRMGASPL